MKVVRTLFGQLIEIADKNIQKMNQKEAQRIQAINEQNRKNIENLQGVALRKRWASALNSLPKHMRISSNDIDSYSLSNSYMQSYWELQVPVQELLSKSKCKEIQEQLTEILNNQFAEVHQEFEQKIINDSIEYAEQLCIMANGGSRTKEDFFFISNYNKFASANYHRLINVEIIDMDCIEHKLHIQYKIDERACHYFHGDNYWKLIGYYCN